MKPFHSYENIFLILIGAIMGGINATISGIRGISGVTLESSEPTTFIFGFIVTGGIMIFLIKSRKAPLKTILTWFFGAGIAAYIITFSFSSMMTSYSTAKAHELALYAATYLSSIFFIVSILHPQKK